MEWTNTSLARLLIRDIFLLAALVNTEWLRGVKIRQLARLVVRAICKLYALTQLSGSKAVAAPDQRVGVVHAQATQ